MNRTIKINTENAAKLKDFRIKHRVKSKDLALFIGKSPAYISKLEHGDIQHLSKDVLIKITNYISGDENGYTEFCQSVIESKDPDTSEKDIWNICSSLSKSFRMKLKKKSGYTFSFQIRNLSN